MNSIKSRYTQICIIALSLSACDGGETYTQSTNIGATNNNLFMCDQGQQAGGDIVDVSGGEHVLRQEPEPYSAMVINEKATRIMKYAQYHSIDSSTRVQIQCEKDDWVRVAITEPEWLAHVKGWTKREYLLPPRTPGEIRIYTKDDIPSDKNTKDHKEAIVEAINKIHKEHPKCNENISLYRKPN
jgi:hypothetical protein